MRVEREPRRTIWHYKPRYMSIHVHHCNKRPRVRDILWKSFMSSISASNFDLLEESESERGKDEPKLIKSHDLGELWWKIDDR